MLYFEQPLMSTLLSSLCDLIISTWCMLGRFFQSVFQHLLGLFPQDCFATRIFNSDKAMIISNCMYVPYKATLQYEVCAWSVVPVRLPAKIFIFF